MHQLFLTFCSVDILTDYCFDALAAYNNHTITKILFILHFCWEVGLLKWENSIINQCQNLLRFGISFFGNFESTLSFQSDFNLFMLVSMFTYPLFLHVFVFTYTYIKLDFARHIPNVERSKKRNLRLLNMFWTFNELYVSIGQLFSEL